MPQSSRHRSQQPLDTLQSMINGVLLETGKALRSANKKGPQTIGQTNVRLQAFIPGAMDKFHLALDELETDIVRAQAVLSRDLNELRAKKHALSEPKIEQMEDDSPAAQIEESDPMSRPMEAEILDLPTETASQSLVQPGLAHDEQASNLDHPIPKDPITSSAAHSHTVVPPPPPHSSLGKTIEDAKQADPPITASHSPTVTPILPPHLSLTKAVEDVRQAEPPSVEDLLDSEFRPAQEVSQSTSIPAPATEQSSSKEFQEVDLDSMFGEVEDAESNKLTFDDDMNFTGGGQDNTNIDFGDANGDLDLSSFGDPVHNSNDEVNDMLKGFDGFAAADSSNDFSMMDLGNTSTSNAMDTSGGKEQDDFGMSGGDLDMALGLENNESTFDDLLDGIDFGDGVDNSGQDLMEHGEFDDAFFGMGNDG